MNDEHLAPLVTGWRTWRRFVVRHAGFPADMAFALGDTALTEAADRQLARSGSNVDAEFEEAFEAAAERMTAVLRKTAADPRFREAVGWQNPKLVTTCLDKVVRGEPRNVRGRNHEATVAAYTQRYGLKNDTIGFFGPVAWGEWSSQNRSGITWRDDTEPVRTTYHECWAIDTIAQSFCEDPLARPYLVPKVSGAATVDGRRVRGVRTTGYLGDEERAVLGLVDGQRDVRTIAAELAWTPQSHLGSLEGLWPVIEKLVAQDVVVWAWVGPIEARPEQRLYRHLERIADPAVRQEFLGRLDRYLECAAAVDRAREDDVALADAFDALAHEFKQLTGRAGSRRDGQNYAGRTLVYQDSRSELSVTIDEIGRHAMEPLAPILDSANWLTDRVADGYAQLFNDLYDAESADGPLPLATLLSRATPHLYLTVRDVPAIVKTARRQLQERWVRIHGARDNGPDVTLDLADVSRRAAEEFGPARKPSWPYAHCHTPDVMIAGTADALAAGEARVVLGELHVGVNTLESRVFLEQSDDPDGMLRASECSLYGTRYYAVPAKKWPWVTSRLSPPPALLSDQHRYWSLHEPSIEAPVECVPAAELTVQRVGKTLRVFRGEEDYGGLLHVVGDLLSASVANGFSVTPPWRRRPRITVGGLVIARRAWTIDAAEIAWAKTTNERRRFVQARRWRLDEGIPERAFYKVPIDDKPLYVDGGSIVFVNALAKAIRQTAEKGGTITFTEMLPDDDELWLHRDSGRHTSELRIVAVSDAERYEP